MISSGVLQSSYELAGTEETNYIVENTVSLKLVALGEISNKVDNKQIAYMGKHTRRKFGQRISDRTNPSIIRCVHKRSVRVTCAAANVSGVERTHGFALFGKGC